MGQPSPERGRGPIRGAGVGLRSLHYEAILTHRPEVPWFEALVDNYLAEGCAALRHLEKVRRDYAVTFHGVDLSLGSTDPLDTRYLRRLKALVERYEPAWVSDHLCWISVGGDYVHDLLPLPYLEEAARHVAEGPAHAGVRAEVGGG
jgi:uncharacterized protein (UPF0276 family)